MEKRLGIEIRGGMMLVIVLVRSVNYGKNGNRNTKK